MNWKGFVHACPSLGFWSGSDGSSKRLTKILVIGFALFFGSGVAISHVYAIALDAFQITLPTPSILGYLLNAGDLAGNLTLGIGAAYARGVGLRWADIPETAPVKTKSMLAWLLQGLEPIGFSMFVLGFTIGFGPMAFAAFVLIVAGAMLLPIGYVIRRSAVSKS